MNRDLFAASGVGGGVVEATPDPYFKSTTLLLSGDGTNGAQNNTFIDSSTNNAAITRSGSPTQGSFSPFSQTGWSGYFDGSSYLTIPSSAGFQFPTGTDFTVECWVNFNSVSGGTSQQMLSPWGGNSGWQLYWQGANKKFTWYANASSLITGTMVPVANIWYHVAISRQSGVIKSFVNGVLDYSVADTANYAQTSPLYIGVETASTGYFNGYISNVRIVKGTAVYTTTSTTVGTVVFTPPTAPLTATQAAGTNIAAITGTSTSLLTLQDNRFKDNALTPNTITVAGTPSIQAFSPFAPTTTYSASAVGGSMYFDGSSYISVPDNVAFTMGAGDFTLEAWVYLTNAAQQVFIGTFDAAGSASSPSFTLGLSSTGLPRIGVGYAGVIYYANAATSIVANTWVHIAGVRNGASVYVYTNGVQSTALNMAALAITDSTQIVAIGRNGAYNGEYVTGYISNVRIVKGTAVYTGAFTPPSAPLTKIQSAGSNITALSGTETSLLLLGTNAGIYDATAKNDIVTVGNAQVSSTQIKYGTGAMYFDGTGDYLALPASTNWMFGTGDFTVEFWINTAGANSQILSLVGGTAAGNWQISLYGGSIYWQSARNTTDTYVVSSSAISNSAWHHVAYCRTSNALKVYFDGVAQGAGINDTTNYNISSVLNVGYSSSYFTGYLDDLRVTKYARYTAAFTPPTKAMIGQ